MEETKQDNNTNNTTHANTTLPNHAPSPSPAAGKRVERSVVAEHGGAKIVQLLCLNPDERLFENQYELPTGMSYTCHVLHGTGRLAVVDTVDPSMMAQWQQALLEELDGRQPDLLVVEHLEPDHSAGMSWFLNQFPDCRVVCSAKSAVMMPQFVETPIDPSRIDKVGEGQTLDLGGLTLRFFMAPMVHWPEVMTAYEENTRTLFSADAFGTFGTEFDGPVWIDEMRRYYFNICGKYGAPVAGLLKKLKGVDINHICTLHGPVLESWEALQAVENYRVWASYQPETQGVFIAYATLHGNTAAAARRLAAMLADKGVKNVSVADLARTPLSESVSRAFRYSATVFMAATYDAGLTPAMDDFLHHLQSKTWQRRFAATVENGSWAPVAGRLMRKALSEGFRDVTLLEPCCTIRTRLDEASTAQLEVVAQTLAEIINK